MALEHGEVFITSGSIEDFEFAEEISTTAIRNKCSTPLNIVPDAILTVM